MISETIDRIYEAQEGSQAVELFCERNGIRSLGILTVCSEFCAQVETMRLVDRIRGQVVVEIGAGVGLLSCEMARYAKRVFAIECDPAWSWAFVEDLYRTKPPNLTWIFGKAEEVIGSIRADVAVIYTRSDVEGMLKLAAQFAPVVIHGPLASFREAHADLDPSELAFIETVGKRIAEETIRNKAQLPFRGVAVTAPPEPAGEGG